MVEISLVKFDFYQNSTFKGSSKALENNNEPKMAAKIVKKVKFNLVTDEAENESNESDVVKNVEEISSNRGAGLKSTSSMIGIPSLESLMGFGTSGNTGNGTPLNSISNNAKKMHSLKSILKTRNSVKAEEEKDSLKKIDEKNDDANEDDVACKGDSPKQPFLWSVADPNLRINQGYKRI